MDELSIEPSYIHMLILKARSFMGDDEEVTPDLGGNPTDDEGPSNLQQGDDAMSREEFREEIVGLGPEKQDELVALMWLGRDDGGPEDWPELLQLASQRRETPTAHYLLDHPLVADYWANGLDRLGYGSLLD